MVKVRLVMLVVYELFDVSVAFLVVLEVVMVKVMA